jgi:hypothetical protein
MLAGATFKKPKGTSVENCGAVISKQSRVISIGTLRPLEKFPELCRAAMSVAGMLLFQLDSTWN